MLLEVIVEQRQKKGEMAPPQLANIQHPCSAPRREERCTRYSSSFSSRTSCYLTRQTSSPPASSLTSRRPSRGEAPPLPSPLPYTPIPPHDHSHLFPVVAPALPPPSQSPSAPLSHPLSLPLRSTLRSAPLPNPFTDRWNPTADVVHTTNCEVRPDQLDRLLNLRACAGKAALPMAFPLPPLSEPCPSPSQHSPRCCACGSDGSSLSSAQSR